MGNPKGNKGWKENHMLPVLKNGVLWSGQEKEKLVQSRGTNTQKPTMKLGVQVRYGGLGA